MILEDTLSPALPLYYFAIPVLLLSMTIRGMEYTLGQFGCAVLLFSLPKFLSTPSLLSKGPDHEKRWSLYAVQVLLSNGQHSCSSHRIQNTAANGLLWRKLLHPIQTLYMNSKGIGKAFRPGEDKKISHHLSRQHNPFQALSGRAAVSDHLQAFILGLDIGKLILLGPASVQCQSCSSTWLHYQISNNFICKSWFSTGFKSLH